MVHHFVDVMQSLSNQYTKCFVSRVAAGFIFLLVQNVSASLNGRIGSSGEQSWTEEPQQDSEISTRAVGEQRLRLRVNGCTAVIDDMSRRRSAVVYNQLLTPDQLLIPATPSQKQTVWNRLTAFLTLGKNACSKILLILAMFTLMLMILFLKNVVDIIVNIESIYVNVNLFPSYDQCI